MMYYKIEKKRNHILLIEDQFDQDFALKTETVFAQCNGYMGIRASHETKMLKESRGMFVAGLYHQASAHEVTELIHCPDIVAMDIQIDGEKLQLDTCQIHQYRRSLNVMTGELEISVRCDLTRTKGVLLRMRRFASLENRHLFCHQVELTVDAPVSVEISTGINGQMTNSGVSHFDQVVPRVFDKQYMYTKSSCDDKQGLELMSVCASNLIEQKITFGLKRRSIYGNYQYQLENKQTLQFHKYSFVDTTMGDPVHSCDEMRGTLQRCEQQGYDQLLLGQERKFSAFWNRAQIHIEGASLEEEAAICFAQYHLFGMAPFESSSHSIGAKGLTGEGYKGHVFWDTEIFIMPFFTSVFPEISENLLKFRHNGLDGAKQKAQEYGYEGAMYPWEVSTRGTEETPLVAALNIHTGVATKVWSGIKEHHVTADIIYALWHFYMMTGNRQFLEDYGYEMLIETAIFWSQRAIENQTNNRYEILDIIGPDEYTEHIDNNAYTNYMAMENVRLAYETIVALQKENIVLFSALNARFNLEQRMKEWGVFLEKIYLPTPNEEGIIPQDDTFLSKEVLPDIEQYKKSPLKQAVLLDYSRDEIVNMQVLKQADVVMLLNMFPHQFDSDVVRNNTYFYETRTIHDSSLSYCAHSIAYANIAELDLAVHFFHQAMLVDLDANKDDSLDGIHAASLGGVWNCVINGFAGIKPHLEYIEMTPHLPSHWKEMKFYLKVKGEGIRIVLNHKTINLKKETNHGKSVCFKVGTSRYDLNDTLEIAYITAHKGMEQSSV